MKNKKSVYSEEEWEELEKGLEDIKKWEKTGNSGSLLISKRNSLGRKFTSKKIRALRKKHALTQTEFAEVLNASIDTVRAWEQNKSHPCGPVLKLLAISEKHFDVLLHT